MLTRPDCSPAHLALDKGQHSLASQAFETLLGGDGAPASAKAKDLGTATAAASAYLESLQTLRDNDSNDSVARVPVAKVGKAIEAIRQLVRHSSTLSQADEARRSGISHVARFCAIAGGMACAAHSGSATGEAFGQAMLSLGQIMEYFRPTAPTQVDIARMICGLHAS